MSKRYDKISNEKIARLAKTLGYNGVIKDFYFIHNNPTEVSPKLCGDTGIERNWNTDADTISAPTLGELQGWLMEKHKLHVYPVRDLDYWICNVCEFSQGNKTKSVKGDYNSYSDALEAGLTETLKNLQDE